MAKVENISMKNNGVQLDDGNWYTVVGKAANYLNQINKGDKVEVRKSDDGKKIVYIKTTSKDTESPTIPQESQTQATSYSEHKELPQESRDVVVNEMKELMERCLDETAMLFGTGRKELTDEQIRVANTLFIQVCRTVWYKSKIKG